VILPGSDNSFVNCDKIIHCLSRKLRNLVIRVINIVTLFPFLLLSEFVLKLEDIFISVNIAKTYNDEIKYKSEG
jgi:hypothetical protein